MLSLKIAYKFHRSCKKNILISLVSLISIISISIGIAISIISLSIINGFEYELSNRILSIIPHIEVTSINVPFSDWKIILERIKNMTGVVCADPYIHLSGVIEHQNKWNAIYIRSIDLMDRMDVVNPGLSNFIDKTSRINFCKRKNQIILGKGIARALNIKTEDWVTILVSHYFESENKFLLSKNIRVQVSGILDLYSKLDNNLAIISFEDAQIYCNNRLDVDGIEVFVNNAFRIDKIIQKLKHKFIGIKVRSWMDMYGYIYRDIQIVRIIICLFVVLIIGISYFNVISTLIVSIKSKNNDIAILIALGATNIFIRCLFFWYGLIIYGIAIVIGSCIGILIVLNLTNISIKYINIFNANIVLKDIYFINFIPVNLKILDVCLVLGGVLLLGVLITWYASLRIKTINLTKILR